MNFQQHLQTLQFQRYGNAARHRIGGIACDIRGLPTQWESYSATRAAAGSAPLVAQSAARQWPSMVDAVGAGELSPEAEHPHQATRSPAHRACGGIRTPNDETTTFNVDFPAPESRKVALLATRFVHPHSWSQPTKTPTFPHQHAEKSPLQQHVVSYNPDNPVQETRPTNTRRRQ